MKIKAPYNFIQGLLQLVILIIFVFVPFLQICSYNKIVKIELNERPALMTGNNCVWDFSNMTQKSPKQIVRYLINGDSLKVFSDENIYSYMNMPNGLLLISTENPNTLQKYSPTLPTMIPFDMHLGDSIMSMYQSTGDYCSNYIMNSQGTIVVKCLGIGKLKDSINGVLENVLLLSCDNTSCVLISPKNKQLENSKVSNIRKKDQTYFWMDSKTHKVLYRYSTQEFLSGNIKLSHNSTFQKYQFESKENKEEIDAAKNTTNQDPFQIQKLEVKDGRLYVDYVCHESCDMKIQICSIAGIAYKSKSFLKSEVLPSGTFSVSLSNLNRGTYIANVHFNGIIYKKSFNL